LAPATEARDECSEGFELDTGGKTMLGGEGRAIVRSPRTKGGGKSKNKEVKKEANRDIEPRKKRGATELESSLPVHQGVVT